MNLLIEEFALQCKEYKLQVDGARVDFDYKKFAEMIVQECANIARHNVMNISTYSDAEFVEEQIKQHFGVNE